MTSERTIPHNRLLIKPASSYHGVDSNGHETFTFDVDHAVTAATLTYQFYTRSCCVISILLRYMRSSRGIILLTSVLLGLLFLGPVPSIYARQSGAANSSDEQTSATNADKTHIKTSDGVALLRKALVALGDPNAQLAAQSCDISEEVTPSRGSSFTAEWTIDADNYLMTAHTAKGTSRFGSLTPVTIGKKSYTPSPRLRLSHFEPSAATQWLARAIVRPTISISNVTQRSIDGGTFLTVELADATNAMTMSESDQVWYFDPNTYMPARIDYRLPSITRSGLTAPAHVLIHSFSGFSKVLFPSSMSTFIGINPDTTITVSSAACSTQLHPASYFADGKDSQ